MFGATHAFPVYLSGLGQDTSSVTPSWISDILRPISEVVKEYYDLQYQQQGLQAQRTLQSTPFPSISPIYLIGGGLVAWYLLKGGIKDKKTDRKRRRKKTDIKRRRKRR